MLHAFTHRKAAIRSVVSSKRVPFEDLVTSTVFGTLQFLPESDRCLIVGTLADRLDFPSPNRTVEVILWPSRKAMHGFRERRVEPDVMLRLDGKVIIVVEAKWDAPLGEWELAAQWSSLTPSERDHAWHVLLTRFPHAYDASIAADETALRKVKLGNWRSRFRGDCSWHGVIDAVRRLAGNGRLSSGGKVWVEQVTAFLSREEFRVQQGWPSIGLRPVGPTHDWTFELEGTGDE